MLDALKEQAVPEQELELAPPVPYETPQVASSNKHSATASSQRKTVATDAEGSVESITTGVSGLNPYSYDSGSGSLYDDADVPTNLDNGTNDEKQKWLKALFPMIEDVQITETIAKCRGDLQQSIDELLNLSFIHDDVDQNYQPPPVLKGVEGFMGEGKPRKQKAKKNRRKQDKEESYYSDSGHTSGTTTPHNIWQNATEDVDFVVSRTQLPVAMVKSIYHQHNASLPLTIRTLVTKEAEMQAVKIKEDEILPLQVAELKLELEGVADKYIYGALLLAQMIPSAAKDLIEAMMSRPADLKPKKLVAQYTPINLSEDESPRKVRASAMVPSDPALLMGQAGVHSTHADRAFTQASSAFRRGRSDHLMGGAAAYYASVGHEQRKRQKQMIASASDALVGQQSTATSLDLHGVTVEHAVRIARNSVENWWESLGDRKYVVGGIGSGYKIIVGLGTHSAQGIGRIGPAVSKMLMREGWKVNVQRGEIYVEGRARH